MIPQSSIIRIMCTNNLLDVFSHIWSDHTEVILSVSQYNRSNCFSLIWTLLFLYKLFTIILIRFTLKYSQPNSSFFMCITFYQEIHNTRSSYPLWWQIWPLYTLHLQVTCAVLVHTITLVSNFLVSFQYSNSKEYFQYSLLISNSLSL